MEDNKQVNKFVDNEELTKRISQLHELYKNNLEICKAFNTSMSTKSKLKVKLNEDEDNESFETITYEDMKKLNEHINHKFIEAVNLSKLKKKRKVKSIPKELTPKTAKGIKAPLFVGGGLKHFFSSKKAFGRVDPNDPSSPYLLDELKVLSKGFGLKLACTNMFYIYSFVNQDKIKSSQKQDVLFMDDHMSNSFDKQTCLLIDTLDDENKIYKKDMTKYCKMKKIKPISTFDAIIMKDDLVSQYKITETENTTTNTTTTRKSTKIKLVDSLGANPKYFKIY